jgi:hypothetical protein
MKRKFLLGMAMLSFGNLLTAQELAEETKPLAFKFAPGGLSFGKATLGVEYNVKYRNSVTFYIGVPLEKKKQVSFDGGESEVLSKAFSVMGGYRHYLSDKNMKGFYIEPYAKYLNHKGSGQLNNNVNGMDLVFDTRTNYSGVGVGAQIGLQMIISRSIVLDLFILGPEANNSKFTLTATDISNHPGWSLADKQEIENDIRELLNDVPLVGNKVEVNVDMDNKTVNTAYAGFVPGIRIGGSVGIRF